MPNWMFVSFIYLTPLILFLLIYWIKRHRTHRQSTEFLSVSVSDGLTEAPSLHPVIDPALCIGCGSCVSACPEKNVLGMIHQQAELVSPANCIGHGACKTACPQKAIILVFGSARRGVEIPEVTPKFESNIQGIFIAGELGGMGLIRNAIEQGRQAIDSINQYMQRQELKLKDGMLDCIIVGSGPAGLSATLGAKQFNLNSITIDQEQIGGTISHYPRGKLVMTQAATLPLVGKIKFGEISKEELMKFWFKIIAEHNLKIQEYEVLLSINPLPGGGFELKSSIKSYKCRTVLLTIGRRGSPRKLDVPGEDLSKVVYRLTDPEQYGGMSVLVVGGGDSALETACSIAELGDTKVTLSYRQASFSRAKAKNRQRIADLESANQLQVLYSSEVKAITSDTVIINQNQEQLILENQVVIVNAGGILPSNLLKSMGVTIATKYGEE